MKNLKLIQDFTTHVTMEKNVVYTNKPIGRFLGVGDSSTKVKQPSLIMTRQDGTEEIYYDLNTITSAQTYEKDHDEYVKIWINTATVGNNAFDKFLNITDVYVTDNTTSLGDRSFRGCSNLKRLRLGNNLKTVGPYCFVNCVVMEDVNFFPNSLEVISTGGFCGCSGLTSIVIKDSVKLYTNSFYDLNQLTSVTLHDDTTIGESSFECPHKAQYEPFRMNTLEDGCIVLPKNLKTINKRSFSFRHGVTKIVIPNTVTKIIQQGLFDMQGLTKIIFEGTVDQWNSIEKGQAWCGYDYKLEYVECTDGVVVIQEEEKHKS